jgi:antitoxin VapB
MTEETLTETIGRAAQERLLRLRGRRSMPNRLEAVLGVSRRCAALPDLDVRSPEEILGYDQRGVPDSQKPCRSLSASGGNLVANFVDQDNGIDKVRDKVRDKGTCGGASALPHWRRSSVFQPN